MPKERSLALFQGNPDTLILALTNDDTGSALNLATVSDIKLVIKASADTADAAATVLSLLTGEIVVVSAAAGTATVAVPASVTATAGVRWYRVDCLPGPKTALYGALYVRDT